MIGAPEGPFFHASSPSIIRFMTFSRTALIVVGAAMVAGGAYGVWQYRTAPLQTADLSSTVLPDVASLLPGTWTSADDASYQLVFVANGTFEERYGTSTVAQGVYRFASSPAGYVADDATYETLGPYGYLLQEIEGERYAYRVLEATAGSLQLAYLERGNTLSFTR